MAETKQESAVATNLAEQETSSHISIHALYSPADLEEWEYYRDLNYPGQFPYTRGVQATMYRGRLWTMRQYAGMGDAEESNRRYKYLLSQTCLTFSPGRPIVHLLARRGHYAIPWTHLTCRRAILGEGLFEQGARTLLKLGRLRFARGEQVKTFLRLVLVVFSITPFSPSTPCDKPVLFGRIVLANTINGETFIFIHLGEQSPGVGNVVSTIDDVEIDVNGRKVSTKGSGLGTLTTPTELLLNCSNQPGYLCGAPPYDFISVQVRFQPNDQPATVSLADGSAVTVFGIQTSAMLPNPGSKYLHLLNPITDKEQSAPIKIVPLPPAKQE